MPPNNPITEGEALAVLDVDAIASSLVDWMLTKAMPNGDLLHASVACDYAGMANFKRALSKQLRAALREQPEARGVVDGWRLVIRYGEYDAGPGVWAEKGDSLVWIAALTAAQQPVQEGGGERKGCGDPTCGCDWPSFTEPMEALRFLSGRMKYAGIAEGVARSYARDIDDILAKYDTAPPSAPVGSDDPAYRAGYAQGVDDSRKHECACTRTEALAQQPAQAAPGDDTARMDWLERHDVEVREPLLYGSRAMFHAQRVSDEDEPYRNGLRAQIDSFIPTPPGDDAAGGG